MTKGDSPFDATGKIKPVTHYTDDTELPSDAHMLNWLERHPEMTVHCTEGWWRVFHDAPNGYGFASSDGLRAALELAMKRIP